MPSTLSTIRPSAPDLDTKTLPRQGRAQETFERILAITADLLSEVGIERLSTNLICERAGLTPPALYRYFPNKYAVLHALGELPLLFELPCSTEAKSAAEQRARPTWLAMLWWRCSIRLCR